MLALFVGQPEGYEVVYAHGCDVESNDTSGFDEALAVAKNADLVVFVGGNRNCEGQPQTATACACSSNLGYSLVFLFLDRWAREGRGTL